MRGVCGIDIQNDKTFISFGALKKSRLFFLQETELDIASQNSDILTYLRGNAEILNEEIRQKEKDLSLKVDQVFLNLPWGQESLNIVHDTIPLRRRKKISLRDISIARKHLEDISLSWDDHCLHHFILNYETEINTYNQPPLGVRASKLSLKSCLVWIKDKTYKEARDIFDNLQRSFGGFVFSGVSTFSSAFDRYDNDIARVVVEVGHARSKYVVFSQNGFDFSLAFDFGIQKIIEAIAQRFSLPISVAEEIFNRYVTFRNVPFHKEISVRNGNSYLNISIHTINAFTKNYIKEGLKGLLDEINGKLGDAKFNLSIIGRLSKKKGFYHFLRELIASNVEVVPSILGTSSSLGCMKYGVSGFSREKLPREGSLFNRLFEVYREYF